MSSYANTLLQKNNLKNKHSYRRQGEQSALEKNKRQQQGRGKGKVVMPPISPHSEDCPIGEAEKDVIIGKLLEDRALEISAVAQEIHDIQKEWHQELCHSRVDDNEQCNLHDPKLKEIEDREQELKNIKEEMINILKNRDEERLLTKIGNKGNYSCNSQTRQPHDDTNEEDHSESGDDDFFHGPLRYSCKRSEDGSITDNDSDLLEEDVPRTIDIEDKISFIEGLVEEDLLGSSIDPTLDLLHSLEDSEDIDFLSNLKQQSSDLETQYFEMKNLLEEIERDLG